MMLWGQMPSKIKKVSNISCLCAMRQMKLECYCLTTVDFALSDRQFRIMWEILSHTKKNHYQVQWQGCIRHGVLKIRFGLDNWDTLLFTEPSMSHIHEHTIHTCILYVILISDGIKTIPFTQDPHLYTASLFSVLNDTGKRMKVGRKWEEMGWICLRHGIWTACIDS